MFRERRLRRVLSQDRGHPVQHLTQDPGIGHVAVTFIAMLWQEVWGDCVGKDATRTTA
jgi:hypothetical protein